MVLSSAFLLTSSSFSLSSYLTKFIVEQPLNDKQQKIAKRLAPDIAYPYLVKQQEYGSSAWLTSIHFLAEHQARYAETLAQYYLATAATDQAIHFYNKAISLGSPSAAKALAQHYFIAKQSQLAYSTAKKGLELVKTNKQNDTNDDIQDTFQQLLLLFAELTADLAKREDLQNLVSSLLTFKQGRELVHELVDFQVIDSPNGSIFTAKNNMPSMNAQCQQSIRLYATNLTDLRKLTVFKRQYQAHPFNQHLCITSISYQPTKQLTCQTVKNKAITCNELDWLKENNKSEKLKNADKYIGLMLSQGGANVHFGVLYLDSDDNFEIFIHEMAHLLGFVDEYQLLQSHRICQQAQDQAFAYNIAVLDKYYYGDRAKIREQLLTQLPWARNIADDTKILQLVDEYRNSEKAFIKKWRVGTPKNQHGEVGVFPAETCNNEKIQAFKPITSWTQMRSYSQPMPELYLSLLANRASDYSMPSFHYNVGLAYFKQGKLASAKQWLTYAAKFEAKKTRQLKVLVGEF